MPYIQNSFSEYEYLTYRISQLIAHIDHHITDSSRLISDSYHSIVVQTNRKAWFIIERLFIEKHRVTHMWAIRKYDGTKTLSHGMNRLSKGARLLYGGQRVLLIGKTCKTVNCKLRKHIRKHIVSSHKILPAYPFHPNFALDRCPNRCKPMSDAI
uniref:Uncharacterized protein n=1 Tax=Anopheles atroparvus TaxID=41427 RepID=A0AAG5DF55_ANOAO